MPEITNDAAGFACDRPGVGASAEAATPRDGAHIVAALHALHELPQSQRVRPPDALVGYSLGGLYMQLYARQHPGATQV